MQANELLSAPALARRTLLDRVLRRPRPVQIKELREWVDQTRREMRQSQQRTIAHIAGASDDRRTQPEQHYARFLDDLRKLPDPANPAEFQALQQIAEP